MSTRIENSQQFEVAKKSGVTKSYEELDINKDGVIDVSDAKNAKDATIAKQIALLIGVDEESVLENPENKKNKEKFAQALQEQAAYQQNISTQLTTVQNKIAEIKSKMAGASFADPSEAAQLAEMLNYMDLQSTSLKGTLKTATTDLQKMQKMMDGGIITDKHLKLVEIYKKQAAINYESMNLAFADPESPVFKQLYEVMNKLDVEKISLETDLKLNSVETSSSNSPENSANANALSIALQKQTVYKNNLGYQLSQMENKQNSIAYEIAQLSFSDPKSPAIAQLNEFQKYMELQKTSLKNQLDAADKDFERMNQMLDDGNVSNLELQLLTIIEQQNKAAYEIISLSFSEPEGAAVKQLQEQANTLNQQRVSVETAIKSGQTEKLVLEEVKAPSQEPQTQTNVDELEGVKGVTSNSSLTEIRKAIGVVNNLISKLTNEIAQLDKEIAALEKAYNEKVEEKKLNEQEYANYVSMLDDETANLNTAIKFAENKAQSESELQTKNVQDAVARANSKFNAQKDGQNQPLNTFVQAELAGLPQLKSINMANIDGITNRITSIASDMNRVALKIEVNVGELAAMQPQITAKKSVRDGKKTELNSAQSKLSELQDAEKRADEAEVFKRIDPIGFNDKKGNRFDFVVDRNNDGIFNGTNEFLGAEKQWQEMKALDKDNNGIVENAELSGIKILKTQSNGTQSFEDASSMNLKVDLKSYEKANAGTMKGSGQELLGTYNLEMNDEKLAGYNTLDEISYLQSEYGATFNQSFGSATQKEFKFNKSDLLFNKIDANTIAKNSREEAKISKDYMSALEEFAKTEKVEAEKLDEEFKSEEKTKTQEQPKSENSQDKKESNNPFKNKLR